jgi:site-specific DNA recombinase
MSDSKCVAIYTRVSSEEQLEGYSLSAQAEAGHRFAAQKGWRVEHLYEERGRSGKNALRPEFQRMIRDAQAGMFDVIVVHKLDRFSRSILDMFTYLTQLKDLNVSLVSVTEDFDFTTPMGKILLALISAFAEWYLDNLRTEITKGKKERARQGHWNGRLSWGYTTPKKLREKLLKLGDDFRDGLLEQAEYSGRAELIENVLERFRDVVDTAAVPCPFTAAGVRYAFEQYATGIYSDQDIAKMVFHGGFRIEGRQGNTVITKDTIEDVLQNRFYVGYTSYGRRVPGQKREWMPGAHEPLITEELFEKVQQVRARRASLYCPSISSAKTIYPLTSLLVCADCGCLWKGQNHRDTGPRYRDPARQKGKECKQHVKSVLAASLESQVKTILRGIELPENWQERLRQGLTRQASDTDVEAIEKHRHAIEGRLERLKSLYIMGDLKENDYVRPKAELMDQLGALPLANGMTLFDLKYAVSLLEQFESIVEVATPEERKQIYQSLFRQIYLLDGEIKAIEPTPVLWALLGQGTDDVPAAGRTGFLSLLRTRIVPVDTPVHQYQRLRRTG